MILYIDTTQNDAVEIAAITPTKQIRKQFPTLSAESFSGDIKKFLQSKKFKFSDIKKIAVKTGPGFFSRVRTGVVAANALGFALNVKVVAVRGQFDAKKVFKDQGKMSVQAFYGALPNITKSKGHS